MKLYEQNGKDLFVAGYTLNQRESGGYESYSVWSKTVPALLPKTDLIASLIRQSRKPSACSTGKMGGGHADCRGLVPGHADVSRSVLRFEISERATACSGNPGAEALIFRYVVRPALARQCAGLLHACGELRFIELTMDLGDLKDKAFGLSQPTCWPAVNTLLRRLASEIRLILEPTGLYLYGSLTTGDFDPKNSDVDLMAAATSEISDQQFERLKQMHNNVVRDNPEWFDRIEVAYVSLETLRTPWSSRARIAIISPGEPFEFKEAGKEWLVNWYTVRQTGLTLSGPAPETIIAPISQAEFVKLIREHANKWGDWVHQEWARKRKGQAYAILSMCRALYTIRHKEQVSKRRAALWAQKQLPKWADLIGRALVWREAEEIEPIDHAATHLETVWFVNFVRDKIASTLDT